MTTIELDMLQSFRWLELITIFATSKSKHDLYQCPDTSVARSNTIERWLDL